MLSAGAILNEGNAMGNELRRQGAANGADVLRRRDLLVRKMQRLNWAEPIDEQEMTRKMQSTEVCSCQVDI